ncbi:hypothetical protein V8F33_012329 [Rhypophila sp. PSN 637]
MAERGGHGQSLHLHYLLVQRPELTSGDRDSFIAALRPKQHPSVSPAIITAVTHHTTTSAMIEKQPLLGPSSGSQGGARQTTGAGPLDRSEIWETLFGKQSWIDLIAHVIWQTICTVYFYFLPFNRSSSYTLYLYYAFLFFVSRGLFEWYIVKLLAESLFGPLPQYALQPDPPSHRPDLKPEDL